MEYRAASTTLAVGAAFVSRGAARRPPASPAAVAQRVGSDRVTSGPSVAREGPLVRMEGSGTLYGGHRFLPLDSTAAFGGPGRLGLLEGRRAPLPACRCSGGRAHCGKRASERTSCSARRSFRSWAGTLIAAWPRDGEGPGRGEPEWRLRIDLPAPDPRTSRVVREWKASEARELHADLRRAVEQMRALDGRATTGSATLRRVSRSGVEVGDRRRSCSDSMASGSDSSGASRCPRPRPWSTPGAVSTRRAADDRQAGRPGRDLTGSAGPTLLLATRACSSTG